MSSIHSGDRHLLHLYIDFDFSLLSEVGREYDHPVYSLNMKGSQSHFSMDQKSEDNALLQMENETINEMERDIADIEASIKS